MHRPQARRQSTSMKSPCDGTAPKHSRMRSVLYTCARALLQHASDRVMLRMHCAQSRDASTSSREDKHRDSLTNDQRRKDINLRGFDNGSKTFYAALRRAGGDAMAGGGARRARVLCA